MPRLELCGACAEAVRRLCAGCAVSAARGPSRAGPAPSILPSPAPPRGPAGACSCSRVAEAKGSIRAADLLFCRDGGCEDLH